MANQSSELLALIGLPYEERAHEAKRSFPWRIPSNHPDPELLKDLKAKVTRTIMAMANLTGGGRIVVGVEQDSAGTLAAKGIPVTDLDGWTVDDVMDHVNKYADPEVQLSVHRVVDEQQRTFVVVTVPEFESVPVVCTRDHADKNNKILMRRGATYVRSRRKIETVEVASQTDMRELIDLATMKKIRTMIPYIEQLLSRVATKQSDSDLFDAQVRALEGK